MKQRGMTLSEALLIAAMAGILVSIPVTGKMQCTAKAQAMGMRSDWGLLQGCMIEPKPGQWVPIQNYRVL